MSRQGQHQEKNYENIRTFWESEASEIGSTPLVTVRDHYFRILELHTLLPLVPVCERLLDIGCGTGFGTMVLSRRARYTLGIDYSPTMIAWAIRLRDDQEYCKEISGTFSPFWNLAGPASTKSRVDFASSDLMNPDNARVPFDVITGQRVLINLPSELDQLRALEQLRQCINSSGLLILTEPTIQGYQRTDEFRALFGLPKLERYWHNIYLDEDYFSSWTRHGWNVLHTFGFETYILLSKVVYPAACGQANCSFMSAANAAAMEMAVLFRTPSALKEIGIDEFMRLYVDRVRIYDEPVAEQIASWLKDKAEFMNGWEGLGQQRIILASPC